MIHVTKAEALKYKAMDDSSDIKRGPRGIVNARWLGLSKHRYRRPKNKPARVVEWRFARSRA